MTALIKIMTLYIGLISCAISPSQNQDGFRLVGGPCEGCEAIFEYGEKKLIAADTLLDFNDKGLRI